MKYIFLMLALSTTLCAQDYKFDATKGRAVPSFIGQVKLFKGKVFIKKGTQKNELGHGDRLSLNDTIETSEKSMVRIEMIDDTMITLGPKSELNLAQFDFTDKKNRKCMYSLVKGQLSSDVKNQGKKGDLSYKTKYAVMGVRGTKLLMNFHEAGTKSISQFALTEGKAVVENGDQQSHDLVKGDHLILVHDSSKNSSAHERATLRPQDVGPLAGENINEEDEFRPLLPYHEIAAMDVPIVVEKQEVTGDQRVRLKKKTRDWQQNLDQLNQQLKDNQKK